MTDGFAPNTADCERRGDVPTSVVRGDTEAHPRRRVRSRTWVGIAANAAAGRGQGRVRVRRLVQELRRGGLRPRTVWSLEERAALVAEAGANPDACRCLVAVGGDGTVGSLVNERPGVPITVLPAGTENLFARHFHLSRDPKALAATIAAGRAERIDLGLAPTRRFTLMAGFGFDAEVVTRHHLARVGRAGVLRPTHRAMYVDPVLRASFRYRFNPITVRIDDPGGEETLDGTTVFLFNLPRYALGLPFAPAARGDDGWLDLIVFRKPGPFHALHYLWLVVRGLHLNRPGVEHRRVRQVSITSEGRVPVQIDGDPGGFVEGGADRPWVAGILPGAIDVLVPPVLA